MEHAVRNAASTRSDVRLLRGNSVSSGLGRASRQLRIVGRSNIRAQNVCLHKPTQAAAAASSVRLLQQLGSCIQACRASCPLTARCSLVWHKGGCTPQQHSHFHEAQRALLAAAGAFVPLLPPLCQLGTGGAGRRCLARGRGRQGLCRAFPWRAFWQHALVECSAVLVEHRPCVRCIGITELWQERHPGYGQIRLARGSWAVEVATGRRSSRRRGCTGAILFAHYCKCTCKCTCPHCATGRQGSVRTFKPFTSAIFQRWRVPPQQSHLCRYDLCCRNGSS